LRARGDWDPTVARRSAEDRAAAERQLANTFATDPELRKTRVRDIVSTVYLAFEVMNMLEDALNARGIRLTDVISEGSAREFVDAMPSGDVFISLKTAAHRNPQTHWTPNTIFDIHALSAAVPYCQVVATDHAACHALKAAGLAARLGTAVVSKPDDLIDRLKA
jgi:hypothetical protein